MAKPAIAAIALIALCVPVAIAQRVSISGGHTPTPGAHGAGFTPPLRHSTTRVFVGNGFQHRPFRRNWGFYSWPYFADYGYDSEPYDYPQPAPPQPAVQAPPAVPEAKAPLPSPVLLELHGEQWVKVDNFATSSDQSGKLPVASQPTAAIKELPPAVLIFRDGHREEVSSYSIIGPAIYTKADYWSTGSWTRKIQIADLDLPATLKQNQERGLKFEVPSSPNEIMIRP